MVGPGLFDNNAPAVDTYVNKRPSSGGGGGGGGRRSKDSPRSWALD